MPVYKRGDKWYAHVRHKGRQIKRVSPEGGRAEARQLEADLIRRLKDADRKVYYLDDALAKWLDEYASKLRAYKKYAEHAKQLVPFVSGRLLVDAPDVARDYIGGSSHLRPATINQRLRILRRLCNVAFAEWRWIDAPIGKRIKTVPESRRVMYLSPEQVEDCANCAFSSGVADAIRFAAFSGVRLGELERLGAHMVRDGILYLDSKTKSGRARTIPLPKRIHGIPLPIQATRFQIQDQFRTATRKLGMVGVRFHDLRHTYASLLLQRGASLSAVCELLGHSTVAITKDLYGHLEHSHLEAAVKLLDDL